MNVPVWAATVLNALLKREEWARERTMRHGGKTIRLGMGGFGVSLTIDSAGYVEKADSAIVPDVTLNIVPEKLGAIRRAAKGEGKLDFAEVVHISGDAALAQVVAELAKHLRWDIQDDLARAIGDIPAAKLIASIEVLRTGVRNAGERVAENVSEYLAEEHGMLVGRAQLDQSRQDVAKLNADLDGLTIAAALLDRRLARLTGKRSH